MAEVATIAAVATASVAILKTFVLPEITSKRQVRYEIDQLGTTLQWLRLYGEEAYKNRKSDKKYKLYMNQMLDIALEAEDIIEEFIIKTKRGRNSINLELCHDLRDRIRNINEKVKLIPGTPQSTGDVPGSSYRDSSFFPVQQKIKVRRAEIFKEEEIRDEEPVKMYENSEKQVIDLLTGEDKELRIISIIGMGGVEKYTPEEVFMSIMKSSGSGDSDAEVTSEKVSACLKRKKYLIVLDDIWDIDAWTKLKGAFPNSKNGSRVLLTTRHKRVALEADKSSTSNNIHELSAINDEKKSWELFLKNYLPYSSGLVSDIDAYFSSHNLVEIGNQMMKKCHGLPLAIVVLGSLLSSLERKQSDRPINSVWSEEFLRSSWLCSQGDDSHKCPGILALSYDFLPYHLQPCFLYMSLFPGTSMIRVTKLFQYWIAEGFIQSSNGSGQTLEDIAKDYLEELIDGSLIQVGKRRSDGSVSTCHIHGLLHSISDSESTEDKFSQTFDSVDEFNSKQDSSSRRVVVYSKEQNEKYLSGSHNPRVRALMCHGDVHFPKDKCFNSLFEGFKSLRVLELNGYTKGIVSLPKAVEELIHLRYLSFGETKLQKINTSYLRKLVNLQTLNLKGHEVVAGDQSKKKYVVLDDQIWYLNQLRHLYLKNIGLPAANHKRNWPMSTVPKFGIDNLKQLQLLFVQAGDWINDGGLDKLSSVRKLKIEECLSSHSEKICGAVAKFTELRSLALIYKTCIDQPVINEELPLASIHLSDHTSLISLHLKGRILNWSRNIISFPSQLCKLKLSWSWITEDPMPILENLSSLRFLHLGFESYRGERMVCSSGGFVSLQTLELVSILSLTKWKINKRALVSLAKLVIRGCENLKKIPRGLRHLNTLKNLRVANMPQLFLSRMAENVGKDWRKIQHIPSKDIQIFLP
ncbi:probable disease resistance protein RF9 [Papaver somniferum]|uniref:probable disease resistance protein RF9 n=1 Tax=Papaver somniferum TaxID=3469 RepID=UPI000E7021E1|nr:probable disease resistance protein RF9 [Papaver somniferum]